MKAQKINKAKVKRILVITLTNIGDIILTTPVIETLLAEFPMAELDVMTGPSGKELFTSHKKVKETIIYNKKSSPANKFKLFLKLRKKSYNLIVDLRNTVLPFVLGARYNTNPLRKSAGRMHKKYVHLSRLEEIGIDISKNKFYIPVEEKDKECVDNLLKDLGKKPFIVVSPGAKSHVKRWPLKNFAKLCNMIKKELNYETVLIGDEFDRTVIERMLFYMKTKPLNLMEKTNIHELAYLIHRSLLLITNDSAPMHVGSAVDSKVLAFFGPTDQAKYGPLTDGRYKVLSKNLKCVPCEEPQCINFENKYECLKTISVDEAFEAVKELCK